MYKTIESPTIDFITAMALQTIEDWSDKRIISESGLPHFTADQITPNTAPALRWMSRQLLRDAPRVSRDDIIIPDIGTMQCFSNATNKMTGSIRRSGVPLVASHIVQCAGWALYGRELRGDIVIEGSGPAGYAVRLMGGFRERKGRMPIEGDKIEVHYMMNRYLSLNISASDYAELSRKYMGHGAGTKGHYKMYVVSEFAIKVIV